MANESKIHLPISYKFPYSTNPENGKYDRSYFEELEKFVPFGEDNPKPLFLAKDLTIVEMQNLGQDGKHLRLMVRHNTPIIRKTIGFCFGSWCTKIKIGNKIDMLFEVDINEWNGNRELQLKIIDLKINK